ncbi:MAG: helicase C-terminal domain-containing protein, partial [Nanoarchaeota archaeon]
EEKNKKLLEILSKIENNLEGFLPSIDILKDKIKKEYPDGKPPKAWRKALRISDWLKDFHCKVEDYVYIIENTSEDNIIKNPQGDYELIFNCLEENYLMHKYFHTWSDFTIFMSATFSDPNQYLKDMALKGAKYIKVPSQFDFEKSPIHFYNQRRMSYREIDKNLPWLYEKINEIIDNHKSDNGIIHTASYHLTLKIHNNLSKENKKRILVYSGTEEKRKVLDILKKDKSKILMGPSLLEGLDLKNDWSRFQIFAKVPYLSLGDRFVKTKMDINPGWYQSKAIINILQGTGRSVRSEDDWAITYILDGSLSGLIHRNRKAFPIEFIQRLNIIRE